MKHGSLFSGIGGFDLAADWMGWENVFHCEWNDFGKKILKYYWPNSISYDDIKKTDFTIHRGTIDIISGGFPCQPYSTAGKRLGKDDERHLWPEMLRAIREIQPRWVVGENVRGLVNWSGGLVFDEVQTDLENEGFEVWAFMVPACGVNAPHRRDRIWFVAYADGSSKRSPRASGKTESNRRKNYDESSSRRKQAEQYIGRGKFLRYATDTNCRRQSSKKHRQTKSRRIAKKSFSNYWENFPTQSPICSGNDGLSSRLDGITFPKWRNESIKGAGNAIVPQVAFEIFKSIEDYEKKLRLQPAEKQV